ncbi:MAG: SusC/RagA family TonB-linked outer membrane protein [Cytophagaceae bacterium]|nr:SusC/RagA family TonB-linked outer membrane protein [Cytophagaceae bacterium]MBK9935563.1 SusC/RagA family TonB-linked outer membrane protein [Cytophagaceae bacterium]MBL0324831.1 SusC/RagA family TonB-linked outer membrane protein [Cytophagaceae bacterium]
MQKNKRYRNLKSSITGTSRLWLWILGFVILGNTAFAQKTITGKVTDATDKSEMIGVTVSVKGTTIGTQTDLSGNYTIKVPEGPATLVFSFIGKLSQEVILGNQTTINVALVDDSKQLEEVVVVAYGTRKKADLTGSVIAINSKDFQKGNIQSGEQLLQGKVAGLQVTSGGGQAGGGSTIRIRGAASLNASNDPLIVIDGIPVEGNSISGSANLLNTINPNDIESMSVLKDASATALYGSRASNGVIIITTKKGAAGKPTFNFNTSFSASQIYKKVEMLTGDQVREIITAQAAQNGDNTYKNLLGTENTNWQDQIFRTAIGTDNNLSAGGTYKKIPFRVSLGYSNQNGLLKKNNFARTSGALSLSPKFLDNALAVNVNLKLANTQNNFSNEDAIGSALRFDPTQPVYANNAYGGYWEWLDATGKYKQLSGNNPVGLIELRDNTSSVNRMIGNIELDYKLPFLPDLHLKTNLGLDNTKGSGSDVYSALSSTNYLTNGRLTDYNQSKSNKLWDVSLYYEKDLTAIKSKIDVLALHSYQDFVTNVYNYPSYSADGKTVVPGTEPIFATDKPQYRLESYLGRVNYSFMGKYLATASIRRDASSKFSPSTRVGLFPAAALAWKVKEDLFKNTKVVSDLKLRAGWGVTGQQDFGQYYPYMARYSVSTSTGQYQFGDKYYNFYRPAAYDANITWETTTTKNLGLDFGFADNRITGTVELFQKDTKDLLATVPVAYGSTFDINLFTNVGSLTNKGVEVVLNTTPIKKDKFRWDLGFNFTKSNTEITALRKQEDPNFTGIPVSGISGGTGNTIGMHAIGQWPYAYYVYQQVYDENNNPIEGVYVDRNKDGQINDADRYLYQKPAPNILFGINTALNYKNFTISASGHAMVGNYLYNNFQSERSVMRNLLNPVQVINNASALLPTLNFFNNQYLSDYYVENASFFRLDNINAGYYVGKVFGNTTLSLNASVNNVFFITKYSGLDPENSGATGVDNTIYPRPRVFTFGLNFDF